MTKRAFAVLCLFLLIGVAYNLPLVRHFDSAIPYIRFPVPGHEVQRMNMGDHLNLYYNFWLLKDNLLHLRNPLSDPYQFFYWGKRFFNPQIALFSVFFTLFSPLGDIVAFNLVFLFSFALAGGATFLWLRKVGISSWSALVGGAIVALAPHRLSQMCGHINGLFYFAFPLMLYFAEGMVTSSRRRYPVLLGFLLLIMAWTEYHMFYYSVLFLAPYGLFVLNRMVTTGSDPLPWGRAALMFLLEGAGIGIMTVTLAVQKGWPYGGSYFTLIPVFALGFTLLVRAVAGILSGFAGGGQREMADRLAGLFLPLILLALFPLKLYVEIPQFGRGLSVIVVILMLVRGVQIWRKGEVGHFDSYKVREVVSRISPVLPFVLLAGGVVIAIKHFVLGGTIAEKGRRIVEIRYFSPRVGDLFKRLNYEGESMLYLGALALGLTLLCAAVFVLARWVRRRRPPLTDHAAFWMGSFLVVTFLSLGLSVAYVPLYPLFYKFVPYFKYPRVPGRMIFISYAAMAFCAAWALDRLKIRGTRWKILLCLALFAGILIDYFPPRPVGICLLDRGKTVYDRMDKKGMPPKTLLELPVWPGDSAWSTLYQYYVTRHRSPMVNGYSPVVAKDYVDDVFYGLYPMDVGEVSPKSLRMLRRLKVRYVTFHADAYPYKICPFPSRMVLKRLKTLPFLEQVRVSPCKTLFKVVPPVTRSVDRKRLETIDSPVGVLWEAERSRHLIGKVIPDPDASGGKALVSFKRGKRGMMMGNQHRFFPAGRYEGLVRIKTWRAALPRKAATLGAVLVMGQHRRNTLTMKIISTENLIPDTYTDIRFAFCVPRAQKIECVVYSNGTVPLCLDYAYIAFRGRGEGPGIFQAEDLFHQAPVRSLPDGRGDAVCFTPDILNDRSLWGPLHRLLPGRYKATFYMAIGKGTGTKGPVVLIQAARGHQREVLASRRLRAGDWETPGRLTPFTFTFSLKRPSIMQFPLYYEGNGTLWVDRIEVAKAPAP